MSNFKLKFCKLINILYSFTLQIPLAFTLVSAYYNSLNYTIKVPFAAKASPAPATAVVSA